jgi:hypothetical protein
MASRAKQNNAQCPLQSEHVQRGVWDATQQQVLEALRTEPKSEVFLLIRGKVDPSAPAIRLPW